MSKTPKTSELAILIPYSQGAMLYHRPTGGDLRCAADTPPSRHAVLDFVRELPQPRLAVILGRHPGRWLMDLLLQESDLCVIPDRWVQHIPIWKSSDRAQLAMQLTDAFLSEPIRLFGRKNTGSAEQIERTAS